MTIIQKGRMQRHCSHFTLRIEQLLYKAGIYARNLRAPQYEQEYESIADSPFSQRLLSAVLHS